MVLVFFRLVTAERGQGYESHTKCITEEERYSGKGFMAKEKKGEMKQNAWVEMVQSVLDEQKGAPKNVLRIIETISKHNNTPRKKPKFINFVKNVCGQKTNPKDIDQAWDMISVKLSALSNSANNKNKNQKNDVSETNGQTDKNNDDSIEKDKEDAKGTDKDESEDQNGVVDNHDDVQKGEEEVVDEKKLTKKQRKEEKKRQKYEAELQSAIVPPPEEEILENTESKKGKKKKNKTDSTSNGDDETQLNVKDKNKKRKRQDTVNGNHEVPDNEPEAVEMVVVTKEKTVKKKLKTDDDELEESICLHDQNVAKIEELHVKDKFNWHAVILSVLEKKGNELPFKRLQKKVLGEYSEATGQEVDDRIADKFIKKLKSAPNVRVDKNRVLLLV